MNYLDKLKLAAYDANPMGGMEGLGGAYQTEMVVSVEDAETIIREESNKGAYHLFSWMQKSAYQTANDKGFHEKDEHTPVDILQAVHIALIHSEVSEMLEASRKGNPPDNHLPELSGLEAEAADVMIRLLDFCETNGIDLGKAVMAKMDYNDSRPRMNGGKLY